MPHSFARSLYTYKTDQLGISSFVLLEIRALQRQPSWWWLLIVKQLDVIACNGHISAKNNSKLPLKKCFQALQNLTSLEFVALFLEVMALQKWWLAIGHYS